MGFTFHNSWDGYLIFSRDGIYIHHWPCANPAVPKATGCYVSITEADKLYEEYKARNIIHPNDDLQDMPRGMRQFSILANGGNIIHFRENIAR